MRKDIKESILRRQDEARQFTERFLADPAMSLEEVTACVHGYVCYKFFLDPAKCKGMRLMDMAQKSIEKAIEMNIPIAKEGEKASTCGGASSVAMKLGLLMMAMKRDFQVELSPAAIGMARDTDQLGELVHEARNS